jgi:hypothetical protein
MGRGGIMRFGRAGAPGEATMKAKLVVLAACTLCMAAGVVLADTISITQPVGGSYKRYSELVIKWDYTILSEVPSTTAAKEMEIWLARPSSTLAAPNWVKQIAKVDVMAGSYKWMINAEPGSYRVHFYKRSQPLMGSCAVSELFTIEPGQLKAVVPANLVPLNRIEFLAPLEGQEFTIGSTMTIRWKTDKISNYPTVWLEICWPDGKSAAGAYPTQNTGSYAWTIGETAENSLRVKVYTPDNKFKGMSGTFKVKFPAH